MVPEQIAQLENYLLRKILGEKYVLPLFYMCFALTSGEKWHMRTWYLVYIYVLWAVRLCTVFLHLALLLLWHPISIRYFAAAPTPTRYLLSPSHELPEALLATNPVPIYLLTCRLYIHFMSTTTTDTPSSCCMLQPKLLVLLPAISTLIFIHYVFCFRRQAGGVVAQRRWLIVERPMQKQLLYEQYAVRVRSVFSSSGYQAQNPEAVDEA